MSAIATEPVIPRVWIGCLACYNAGRLVGEWVDAEGAADVDVVELHQALGAPLSGCEELWVFDHEHIPVDGELDPLVAAEWGDRIMSVDEHLRPALLAWVRGSCWIADSDDLPVIEEFVDRYRGHWDSFQEFAHELIEELGILRDLPEYVRTYFDVERWAADVSDDFTVEDAPEGGVYVFEDR